VNRGHDGAGGGVNGFAGVDGDGFDLHRYSFGCIVDLNYA
jgi:hypothetical protein